MASIAAGESLMDQQIGLQIERRLSEDAFSNVNVSVQASVVSLSGTVASLLAKEAALAKARELADVTSVVSDALDIGEQADPLPAEELPPRSSGSSGSRRRWGLLSRVCCDSIYYVEVYGEHPRSTCSKTSTYTAARCPTARRPTPGSWA